MSSMDAISGEALGGELIKKARQVEMVTFKKDEVYEKVSSDEGWRITRRALVGVKWVDTNKDDEEKPEYRCAG